MGNASARPHPRQRNNKKQVHWRAADRPARPGKPQLVSDTDGTPDVITIRWDRPLKDGGSPITGYLVEHRRTGSPHWVRATPLLVPCPELVLSGLEPGWRYQFRVRAENAVGLSDPSELSEPLIVTLQRSAVTSPRFTHELADTIALENEKVEFVVYFLGQPPPKVAWFKDGFEIFSSRRIRILTESDRSVLTIHQSQLVDAGEIRCSATNKAGHASTKAILTLEAPPSIRLPRQYEEGLLFEIGEVIRLKVSTAGLPVPFIFWSHNGESIKNTERYEIESFDNSTTLRINEARRTDRGEYQVKAVNKLGQDQASFLVTVTDKPSPPGKARVLMTLGRSVTLAWNTPEDDGGCKIGNYIVEYYRLGWDVWLKAATSRQQTAVLGDLIEDTKRGITAPLPRSASQPREIPAGFGPIPALPERKNKPRSQSSSRVEDHRVQFNVPNGVPVRPERTKLKSPQSTPEVSPRVIRRELNPESINKNIFDRTSVARDLSYGTPEFKIKKNESDTRNAIPTVEPLDELKFRNSIQIIDNKRSRSPSPMQAKPPSPKPAFENRNPLTTEYIARLERSKSPSPNRLIEPIRRSKSPSPQKLQHNAGEKSPSPPPNRRLQYTRSPSPNFAKKESKDFTGSSEFMLVLLPHDRKADRDATDIDVSFDENQIPPPLSLSAPELGAEPPAVEGLKYSASSTELLHERAIMRFYEAAEAEELEIKRKLERNDNQERRSSVIPKIRINSLDEDEDSFLLERKVSLRRRYSTGITSTQKAMWTQRRHSLKNSGDLNDLLENKLRRYPMTIEEKRELMKSRKRSESEEKEEEEFRKVRVRMVEKPPSHKKRVDVVDLNKWVEYEESISEEEVSSEEERIYDQVPDASRSEDEEDATYHPTMRGVAERTRGSEPFEILTKPNKLPDPNFIPKPILKRSTGFDLPSREKSPTMLEDMIKPNHSYPSDTKRIIDRRQSSPIVENRRPSSPNIIDRRPNSPKTINPNLNSLNIVTNQKTTSLANSATLNSFINPNKRGSLPWSAPLALAINDQDEGENKKPLPSITAVASISGIAAAGIIIPKSLLAKKTSEEEAKVAADHYADIVRSYGQKRLSRPSSVTRTNETDEIESTHMLPSTPSLATSVEAKLTYVNSTNPATFSSISATEAKQSHIHNINPKSTLSFEPSIETRKSNIYNTEMSSNENVRNYNGISRSRTNSSSSSQRSSSPSKSGRFRRGSPTVLNKDVTAFRRGRGRDLQLSEEERRLATKSPSRTRTPSKSPGRRKKSSESPIRVNVQPAPQTETITFSTQTETVTVNRSPSPIRGQKAPKMREIMTQTSACIDNFIADTAAKISAPFKKLSEQELKEYAENKVRTTVDYITDLAMFIVACWLYLFSNELLAIPVLLIMVYRQLHSAVSKRLPKWLLPKPRKET